MCACVCVCPSTFPTKYRSRFREDWITVWKWRPYCRDRVKYLQWTSFHMTPGVHTLADPVEKWSTWSGSTWFEGLAGMYVLWSRVRWACEGRSIWCHVTLKNIFNSKGNINLYLWINTFLWFYYRCDLVNFYSRARRENLTVGFQLSHICCLDMAIK